MKEKIIQFGQADGSTGEKMSAIIKSAGSLCEFYWDKTVQEERKQ